MSYFTDQSFRPDQDVPGHVRLRELARRAGADLESLDGGQSHRLSRALESGFRGPARRIMRQWPKASDWLEALEDTPARWWFIRQDFEIVVTGFGPFGPHAENPSKPFAKALSASLSDRFAASYEALGVTFTEIDEFVAAYDYDSQPLLIHCGLAAEREVVCFERYAHNRLGSKEDNEGISAPGRWVVPGAPTALETLFPIDVAAERLADEFELADDVRANTSHDVGDYLCNALYYRSLFAVRQARLAGRAAEACFIHIPDLDTQLARRAGRAVGQAMGAMIESALDDQFARRT